MRCSRSLSHLLHLCMPTKAALVIVLAIVVLQLPELMCFSVPPETFWHQKRVLITGASSGLGEALAYHLSECGASLVIGARRLEQLEAVASRCHDVATPLQLDMCASPETLEATLRYW